MYHIEFPVSTATPGGFSALINPIRSFYSAIWRQSCIAPRSRIARTVRSRLGMMDGRRSVTHRAFQFPGDRPIGSPFSPNSFHIKGVRAQRPASSARAAIARQAVLARAFRFPTDVRHDINPHLSSHAVAFYAKTSITPFGIPRYQFRYEQYLVSLMT